MFLDALDYAHDQAVFRGYEEWSSVVGDALLPVWTGDTTFDDALDRDQPAADDVLANGQRS